MQVKHTFVFVTRTSITATLYFYEYVNIYLISSQAFLKD